MGCTERVIREEMCQKNISGLLKRIKEQDQTFQKLELELKSIIETLSVIPTCPLSCNVLGSYRNSRASTIPGKESVASSVGTFLSVPQSRGLHGLNIPFYSFKQWQRTFPCDAVAGNPPADAGDMGSIPGLGGFHLPRGS